MYSSDLRESTGPADAVGVVGEWAALEEAGASAAEYQADGDDSVTVDRKGWAIGVDGGEFQPECVGEFSSEGRHRVDVQGG